ncbi:outer membrane protein assembly factor BamC [Thiomicrorhabdus sp. Milos-T2]|uniref:outer membrane protein assembly factor BamC n=1 Tax=Thiomicrorhabdus sp. Milos-T2 TaxID=90814 RepID=UPI000494318E|nr:outer membrane protein assembly factor BamC [Thiomicrorhabdus sp. Milos-T2]
MRLYAKTFVLTTSIATISLSGCSTISNLFGSDGSYRDNEGKLVKTLEIPPNLFNPAKPQTEMPLALKKAEQDALAEKDTYDYIPNFKSKGLAIKNNLSERWMEIDSTNSEQVWSSLKRFFISKGFGIAEERKDIGVLKTDYLQRTELVPLDDVGPLTKMLNSWRPELADGVYDKFTARVESDPKDGVVRVYINHSELYSPDANEAREIDRQWRIKPYNPVMEAQALYEAMVFFGSSSEKALAQLKVTEQMVEVVEGEELEGLAFRASMDKSWSYLQAMIYRASWSIDKVKASANEMWVQVPKSAKEDDSFLSSLAFWRDSGKKALPDLLKLKLTQSETDSEKVILTVSSPEGSAPLNDSQRRYVFESLGLLTK